MDSEDKLFALVVVLVAIVLIALLGAGLYSCDRTDERRMECIKTGASPHDCRKAFNSGGGE